MAVTRCRPCGAGARRPRGRVPRIPFPGFAGEKLHFHSNFHFGGTDLGSITACCFPAPLCMRGASNRVSNYEALTVRNTDFNLRDPKLRGSQSHVLCLSAEHAGIWGPSMRSARIQYSITSPSHLRAQPFHPQNRAQGCWICTQRMPLQGMQSPRAAQPHPCTEGRQTAMILCRIFGINPYCASKRVVVGRTKGQIPKGSKSEGKCRAGSQWGQRVLRVPRGEEPGDAPMR